MRTFLHSNAVSYIVNTALKVSIDLRANSSGISLSRCFWVSTVVCGSPLDKCPFCLDVYISSKNWQECTLDRTPVHHRAHTPFPDTHFRNLEPPLDKIWTNLECGRKPQSLETMERTCKLASSYNWTQNLLAVHVRKVPVELQTLLFTWAIWLQPQSHR